jgi:hypothetical protein
MDKDKIYREAKGRDDFFGTPKGFTDSKGYANYKKKDAKNKGLENKKVYTSPTGSKHKIGSQKHEYWKDIERRGKEDKKYGGD